MTTQTALVVGIGGTIGSGVAHSLQRAGWTVRGLARSSHQEFPTVQADLLDAHRSARLIAEQAADTTHVFYAALKPNGDLGQEAADNEAMLTSVLDGLEAAAAPVQRIVHYQGFKYYGVHLGGAVPTPAREDDPPHLPPNVYIGQDRILRERATGASWDAVVLRPDVVVAPVCTPGMSIAMVVGAFAEISRAMDVPLRFPGSQAAYRVLQQFTDIELLADASIWAAQAEGVAGGTYNVTNGDLFRWERLWAEVAEHLGLPVAQPMPLDLPSHMGSAQIASVWADLAGEHTLQEPNVAQAVGWDFGQFVFTTQTDVVSDLNAIRTAGFTGHRHSTTSLLRAIDELKDQGYLPPTP